MLGLNKEKRLIDLLDRRDEQLQVAGHGVQHVSGSDAVDQRDGEQRAGRLDERRRGRAVVRRHSRSEHGRAGAGQRQHGAGDAGLSARGPSRVQRGRDSLTRPPAPTTTTIAANPLGNYRVVESRLAYRRIVGLRRCRPATRRSGGSSAISARRSPTWKTGRSRSRNRRRAARPSSTTTSSCASKPANAAPRR